MITESGKILTLEDFRTLDPATLTTDDVQSALMMINRYSGHGISVLEHSMRLRKIARLLGKSEAFQLACALHDVGEMAGMVDIPSPEKHLPCWAPIFEIQEAFQQRVYQHFKIELSPAEWALLHEWDKASAWMESSQLHSPICRTVRKAWKPAPRYSREFLNTWHAVRNHGEYSRLTDFITNWSNP